MYCKGFSSKNFFLPYLDNIKHKISQSEKITYCLSLDGMAQWWSNNDLRLSSSDRCWCWCSGSSKLVGVTKSLSNAFGNASPSLSVQEQTDSASSPATTELKKKEFS